MTANQSPTAGAGASLTNAPHAHAFVQNGAIHLLQFGRVRPVTRWEAIYDLIGLEGSPYPSSQERARQIRAALKETTQ